MTELRYLPDQDNVTSFEATVTEATEEYIELDGTYFYPEGGGQPADHGELSWPDGRAEVTGARKNHGAVRHHLGERTGSLPEEGTEIEGQIDPTRRDRLTRMHTAQHVVSRVVLDEFGGTTAGNQIHPDRSRIDFEPVSFDEEDLALIERLANEAIASDRVVRKESRPRELVESQVDEGRALLDLIPPAVDPLRVVEIEAFDLCPCGGTHVKRLGQIGELRLVGHENKGAETERLTFELTQ